MVPTRPLGTPRTPSRHAPASCCRLPIRPVLLPLFMTMKCYHCCQCSPTLRPAGNSHVKWSRHVRWCFHSTCIFIWMHKRTDVRSSTCSFTNITIVLAMLILVAITAMIAIILMTMIMIMMMIRAMITAIIIIIITLLCNLGTGWC